MNRSIGSLYPRWIVWNGLAEAAGLGTTFVIGGRAVPVFARANDVFTVLGEAVVAITLGCLLEGILVGVAQERVIRRHLEGMRPGGWTVATAVGAGLAWLVGMIPSTLMALAPPEGSAPSPSEPPAIAQYALAIALGLFVGPILGCAQWVVLRRHAPRASRWLWANAFAWAIGMLTIFIGMDYVPWNGPPLAVGLSVYLVCGLAGLVVGAVHGRTLVRLVRASDSPSAPAPGDSSASRLDRSRETR